MGYYKPENIRSAMEQQDRFHSLALITFAFEPADQAEKRAISGPDFDPIGIGIHKY